MNSYNYEKYIDTYKKYPLLNGYLDYFKNNDLTHLGNCSCKKSYFRVLSTCADKSLNIQINEILMAENLKSGEYTRYVQFAPGTYHIVIHESCGNEKIIFETNVNIDKNLAYTGVIAIDEKDPTDINILIIPEAKENFIPRTFSTVKMANMLFDSENFELATSDGTVLFSGINYGDVSNNVAVPTGTYQLVLRTHDGKNNLLKVPNIDFAPRMHYTLFVVGKESNNCNIKIIIPEEGVNYLDIC
ncbi:MAG: DUF4397 domain-containing protein [Poseidonibacter sp.]|uniref:DUF4397 domain-containing protein n=1 Tax=Poseidonibacter sp. TaxID=2321188 RepID=UPI00359D90A9